MRVDRIATTAPTASGLTPGQPVKDVTRAQTVAVQRQTTPSPPAVGLKVFISDAGRQAANSIGAAGVAPATESPLPHTLMEGVPWPVGLGPPAWPQTQGAADVTKLVAAKVPQLPQQNPALSKAPSGAEIASEAAQAKTVPAAAGQVQAAVAGVSPQSHREARDSAASTESRKASSAYAGDAEFVPDQEQQLHLRA